MTSGKGVDGLGRVIVRSTEVPLCSYGHGGFPSGRLRRRTSDLRVMSGDGMVLVTSGGTTRSRKALLRKEQP